MGRESCREKPSSCFSCVLIICIFGVIVSAGFGCSSSAGWGGGVGGAEAVLDQPCGVSDEKAVRLLLMM